MGYMRANIDQVLSSHSSRELVARRHDGAGNMTTATNSVRVASGCHQFSSFCFTRSFNEAQDVDAVCCSKRSVRRLVRAVHGKLCFI
jgi:hypothetical protein